MIECSGNERALRAGMEVVRPRGTIVQLGLGGDMSVPQNMVVAKELVITGSFRFHEEFPLAVALIDSGRVDLTPLLTGSYPIEEAVTAFERANDRKMAMKVQLVFNS
jgi:L-idonate 5-dehydrogenase